MEWGVGVKCVTLIAEARISRGTDLLDEGFDEPRFSNARLSANKKHSSAAAFYPSPLVVEPSEFILPADKWQWRGGASKKTATLRTRV
jgi:hypothetical protein